MASYPRYGHTSSASFSARSRSSYPSFLSLPETLKLHVSFFWRGLVDASRWDSTVQIVYSDSEIRAHVLKSFILNSLSLVSIYAFDLLLLPLLRGRVHRNVGWMYRVLWLVPLAAASVYLNGSWAGVVAKRSYTLQHGMRSTIPAPSYNGMLIAIASSAYRWVMIFTSLLLTYSLSFIPVIGVPTGFAFLCWVNAYYCFEFTWIARGYTLAQRVRFLEERWAFFFAFGLPSASLCAFCSSLAGAALFALLLPFYIIKATNAHPLPTHPYSPVPPSPTAFHESQIQGQASRTVMHPSPFVPIRIPIFDLVITIDNFVVRLLSVGSASRMGIGTGMGVGAGKWPLPGYADVATDAEEGNCLGNRRRTGISRKSTNDLQL